MGVIKVLPEQIANKIAAGEVIERPASIVKELIENSLDAGATQIEISVKHGGKSLIRVADNGSGMSPEDAELAFQRHATSKISNDEDLNHIATFGFRGEALPSIGAVSRTKLITRTADRSSGVELLIDGGVLAHAKEAPSSIGTVLEVRDLFFNTPARRKFMKSEATELGQITDMVANIAFSRLDVHFILKSSDKTVYDLLPVKDLRDRAKTLLGEATEKSLIPVSVESLDVKIHGVIGKPSSARANRYGQSFYVNGRWIRSIALSYALQDGYHGFLMQGQFPAAVLFIDCDLARVDVNVHPTKQEVKISNEVQIKSLLRQVAGDALRKETDLAPSMEERPTLIFPEGFPAGVSKEGKILPSVSEFVKTEQSYVAQTAGLSSETIKEIGQGKELIERAERSDFFEPINLKDKFRIVKILGQVHHTFILAETDEGLVIVDQHAAHERIQFEALLKSLESENPAKQGLLLDEILELAPKYVELLEESLGLLNRLGFDIEPFGENTFAIRAVPAVLNIENAGFVIKTFLEEREDGKVRTSVENIQEELAALVACKRKSVKAHDAMSGFAIKSLLTQLSECQNPFNCPHGRPTFIKYTFEDLEKQFRRKL